MWFRDSKILLSRVFLILAILCKMPGGYPSTPTTSPCSEVDWDICPLANPWITWPHNLLRSSWPTPSQCIKLILRRTNWPSYYYSAIASHQQLKLYNWLALDYFLWQWTSQTQHLPLRSLMISTCIHWHWRSSPTIHSHMKLRCVKYHQHWYITLTLPLESQLLSRIPSSCTCLDAFVLRSMSWPGTQYWCNSHASTPQITCCVVPYLLRGWLQHIERVSWQCAPRRVVYCSL